MRSKGVGRLGRLWNIAVPAGLLFGIHAPALGQEVAAAVFALNSPDGEERTPAHELVEGRWELGIAPMIVEYIMPLSEEDADILWHVLEARTGKFGLPRNTWEWMEWLWSQEYEMHPDYPIFKAELYANFDPRFRRFFKPGMKTSIRLDEIMWGGVKMDGIPPLEHPEMVSAGEADYLDGDNIVFGVYLDGQARAYPKRILAWHELFNDTVGSVDVTCAYCTLCGSAVLYRQRAGGRQFEFGTSGFLYRSNKLMYDRQSYSLWSALEGVPVAGPLVGSGLRLERLPIVTTTWEEWKRRHPDTLALSRKTGYDRDYSEGAAYKEYFATDRLMFPIPKRLRDRRLDNKQEILGVIAGRQPAAFSARFLKKNPIYEREIGGRRIVILTDESGANRVYAAGEADFGKWDRDATLRDAQGREWKVLETHLQGPDGRQLPRLAAHRAFWFGWKAQFPQSLLIK